MSERGKRKEERGQSGVFRVAGLDFHLVRERWVYQAVQVTEENITELAAWSGGRVVNASGGSRCISYYDTSEPARVGAWVVVNGDRDVEMVCSPEDFEEEWLFADGGAS